jgi:hypothetical protein
MTIWMRINPSKESNLFMRTITLIVALCIAIPTAMAQTKAPSPYTIDMTVRLLDIAGQPITDPSQMTAADPQCAKCGPLTLGAAIATSLCTERREDASETALSKAQRCSLGMRKMHDAEAKLTIEELTTIKGHLGSWGPLVLARIIPLIDPNENLGGQ